LDLWRKLTNLFSSSKHQILKDLVEVLRHQGLIFFEGIPKPELADIEWSFKAEAHWNWLAFRECYIEWSFELNEIYNWNYIFEAIKWRFNK
jgi:hypothetical protein